ncbi:BTB/POZ domain-containing protein [Nymphaea thermarum]|nr:BTB/POZ domain-containing protein [Nymphaea thermarum]
MTLLFLYSSGHFAQDGISYIFPPDVTFFVHGRPIEAHRVILSARSPFFRRKFMDDWRHRQEVRFSKGKLSYPALYSLVHFFYSDRLEIAVDDMEDLIRICKVCECEGLRKVLEKELVHQKYAEYKSLRDVDNSQKRFILQGLSLPEEDRLPAAMQRFVRISLSNSSALAISENGEDVDRSSRVLANMPSHSMEDFADVCILVSGKIFRCHQVVMASRSEYFKARLSRMTGFREGTAGLHGQSLSLLEEYDLSPETFDKMIEYMYTDSLKDIDPDQVSEVLCHTDPYGMGTTRAEEMFDAASRYLLFPLKRAAADALLPHLEMASPAELCDWLILSDMYDVLKIREYCLDAMACNFEAFADTSKFRAMLLRFPPSSGDSALRTTLPSAPGAGGTTNQGNILDDLREKWLEAEAAELDKRDESAALFDRRLEMLILVANEERIHDGC